MEKFKPTEYVKVINVDSEPFRWQYMPEENEQYEHTSDGMHRHVQRSQPEVWELKAGESETIIGACAYIMIDDLYRKLIAKKALSVEVEKGMARKFNYADGTSQDYWISRILVGKEIPTFTSLNDAKAIDDTNKRSVSRTTA